MDPLANLNEQLHLAKRIQFIEDRADENGELPQEDEEALASMAGELATLVLALDGWRRKGGFDPYTTPTILKGT